uniref:Uncharacterized protein n=1 Tax=Peronospora matthiolae TaxID=2874970 RepID=A0AAV1V5X3_9STRA
MRIQYLALLAAAALDARAHGLQVVSDSALPLQRNFEDRQQPNIEGKTERFLTGEDKELPLLDTSTGYASRSLQEGDNGRHLRDCDSYLDFIDEERKARSKMSRFKRKGKKKSKSLYGFYKRSHKNHDEEEINSSDQTEAPTAGSSNDLTESTIEG